MEAGNSDRECSRAIAPTGNKATDAHPGKDDCVMPYPPAHLVKLVFYPIAQYAYCRHLELIFASRFIRKIVCLGTKYRGSRYYEVQYQKLTNQFLLPERPKITHLFFSLISVFSVPGVLGLIRYSSSAKRVNV
jgi:hypothetical protein